MSNNLHRGFHIQDAAGVVEAAEQFGGFLSYLIGSLRDVSYGMKYYKRALNICHRICQENYNFNESKIEIYSMLILFY